MSQLVIQNFLNTYKFVFMSACRQKQIKQIPFPKEKIYTDELINAYSNDLHMFIKSGKLNNNQKYVLKPFYKEFPTDYFKTPYPWRCI
jgi:hypothetical protein